MPVKTIAILDYGFGNIHSLLKALNFIGQKTIIADSPQNIASASHLIIPGVGAFGDAMKTIRNKDLIIPIKEFANQSKPILGICLGMQLLFSESEEFGHHYGLNIIPGRVTRLPQPSLVNQEPEYKIPFIGWNRILPSVTWKNSILRQVIPETSMYFVHSYAAQPQDKNNTIAYASYGHHHIPAVVKHNNIYGCQFHPEKSRASGLSIIESFAKL